MDNIESENTVEKDDMENLVRLTKGFTLSELLSKDGATFEVNFDDMDEDEQLAYNPEDVYTHVNPASTNLIDEVSYGDGECEPFTVLQEKMSDVSGDGKLMKEVIREGYGDVISSKATVTINYNAFLEYNDEPFDSTYIRKKPLTFHLGEGQTIYGLDLAVQTMKINEKSRFLIHYDFAYGKLGCLDRVPAESTVLFEVEIKNCVSIESLGTYENLPEERQKDFGEIYKYCLALCSKGNDFFCKKIYKSAVREYNTAIRKLECCTLEDYADQEKHQQLLLRILTNVVVAYTKLEEPKRACFNANKVFNMCKGSKLKVPVKVYFNNARSLMLLNDFTWAERLLKQAQKIEPNSIEITKMLSTLEAKKKKHREEEMAIAKKMMKTTDKDDFKDAIKLYCDELVKQEDVSQYKIPGMLTKAEQEFTHQEASKRGLKLKMIPDTEECYIVKDN